MGAFSNLSKPILTPLDLKQTDGWREVDSSQTVYVTKDSQGTLGFSPLSALTWVVRSDGAKVSMTSIARATVVFLNPMEACFRPFATRHGPASPQD